jgi:hypothetical protein
MTKLTRTDEPSSLVASWLDHRSMDRTAAYIGRGRQHARLADDELERRWVAAFRTWVARLKKTTHRRALEDLEAEFAVRGRKVPVQLVQGDFKGLIAASKEIFAEMSPEARGQATRRILEDFEAFLQRDRSN